MVNPRTAPVRRCAGARRLLGRVTTLAFVVSAASFASLPTSNDLGFAYTLVPSGSPASVEIRLAPRHSFDSVAIEAASGVASLRSSCDLSGGVTAGQVYVCSVDITGRPSEGAMTVSVIARRSVPGGAVPVVEMHHLSVRNPAFSLTQRKSNASHHDVPGSTAAR